MKLRLPSSRTRRAPPSARRQRGVSLVEVLVSVLVVTIGVVGAVGLQASALRNNQGSYERTQVSILSQAMFDAMRANAADVTAGAYNTSGYVCTAASNPGTLAASDVARWVTTLQQQINPGACGSIACTAGDCTVGVRWDDSRGTGGSSAQVIQMKAQL